MDNVTAGAMNEQGIEFSFEKGGKFEISGALSGTGTFEINDEATSISTTVDGNTSMYEVALTEGTLQLKDGKDK
jgi:hypothetical protein